jgi:hypothetical protein
MAHPEEYAGQQNNHHAIVVGAQGTTAGQAYLEQA